MLVVIFFHAGLGFSGGYIGVDIFFVISGFLITSLIWNDLEKGEFNLTSFWERRARRILPAALVVTLATVAVGWFRLFPHDFENLAKSVAAQAIFCANIVFWRTAGYFGEVAEEQPLLHTWSLAVEEQFYLVVPLLLLALFRIPFLRRKGVVLAVLVVVFMASLSLSTWLVAQHPTAAFFSLPSRAWELALGALLALLPSSGESAPRIVREPAALLGLALILFPVFAYNHLTAFPGLAALPPCVGTALIIWANQVTLTWVGRILAVRPLVFVGLISYSLYLWHWPLIAYSKYSSLTPLATGHRLILIGTALLLAIVSWRYIEMPVRRRQLWRTKRAILTFAAGSLSAVFLIGFSGVRAAGFPKRFPENVTHYYDATKDRAFLNQVSTANVVKGNLVPFGDTNPGARVQMLVWGDSHAMAVLPAFDVFAKECGIAGRAATLSSTIPALGFYNENDRSERAAAEFNAAVIQYIESNHIPNVVLAAFWATYSDQTAPDVADATPTDTRHRPSVIVRKAVRSTVQRLVRSGSQPWIFLQVPLQSFYVPKAMARASAFGEDLTPLYVRPNAWNGLSGSDQKLIDDLAALGAKIIDPRSRFLDATGDYYIFSSDGQPLYVDHQHLTASAAKQFILPLLRESFADKLHL